MKNKAHKLLGLIMLSLSCVSDAKFEAAPFHKVEMKSDFWRPPPHYPKKSFSSFRF